MSQKFEELKQKIQNADNNRIKDIIQLIKNERDNGNIDESEKNSLVDLAKKQLGGKIDLGNFGL